MGAYFGIHMNLTLSCIKGAPRWILVPIGYVGFSLLKVRPLKHIVSPNLTFLPPDTRLQHATLT